ncbi:MAG TPA: FliH/SctL family protein [Opitutaceae bacterium]|jgi:flagellar assembly protein FliH
MAFTKIVAFDRRLGGFAWPGQSSRGLTEAEINARCQAAFHAGSDAARAAADQQMVEMRSDMAQMSEGVFKQLVGIEPAMTAQLGQALPGLALEIARRLLAGFEPPPDVVERLWREALEQLYPERENLELSLCPADAELIDQINPEWKKRYPGLRVRADASLQRGDSLVRSRFGLTDARRDTKLAALEQTLSGT